MAKLMCIAVKSEGKVQNPRTVKVFFDTLKDGKWKLEASSINQRSLAQNAYIHCLLIPEFRKALVSVGYDELRTDDQAKQIMKSMFLTAEIPNKETGEMIKYVRRTRDLSKGELNELIEAVIKFCAEHMNYIIPYPSEQVMMQFE